MDFPKIETIDDKLALWIAAMKVEEYDSLDIFFTLLAGVEVLRREVERQAKNATKN